MIESIRNKTIRIRSPSEKSSSGVSKRNTNRIKHWLDVLAQSVKRPKQRSLEWVLQC